MATITCGRKRIKADSARTVALPLERGQRLKIEDIIEGASSDSAVEIIGGFDPSRSSVSTYQKSQDMEIINNDYELKQHGKTAYLTLRFSHVFKNGDVGFSYGHVILIRSGLWNKE